MWLRGVHKAYLTISAPYQGSITWSWGSQVQGVAETWEDAESDFLDYVLKHLYDAKNAQTSKTDSRIAESDSLGEW
jgi:hypothetical protein